MTAGTASAFGGAGYDRAGNLVDKTQNISRPAKVTIAHGMGASRRGSLWDVKREMKLARNKTREQKSKILSGSAPKYRGTRRSIRVRSRNLPSRHRKDNVMRFDPIYPAK